MQFAFGKQQAQQMKGIAIIAMFFHHFFGFPTWLAPENNFVHTYIGQRCLESDIASFFKICVGIYAFVSGYALFVQGNKHSGIKHIAKRAFKFLTGYWLIFLLFILFGLLFSEPLPPFSRLLQQCFGVSTATGFNWAYFDTIHPVFAWYVSFYLLFLFISPLLAKICRFGFVWDCLIITVVLFGGSYLINSLLPLDPNGAIIKLITAFATWGHIGMTGFIFAKYDVFSVVHKKAEKYLNSTVRYLLLAVLLFAMFFLWNVKNTVYLYESPLLKISYLSIYTPIFIYAVICFLNRLQSKTINIVLTKLAQESTNMWFLHGLFFTPNKTIQWLAYLPKYPILILLWTLLLTYLCSLAIRYTVTLGTWCVNKLKKGVPRLEQP